MDWSRPDSINQQRLIVQKSPRKKPHDNLAPDGPLDLSQSDSINQQKFIVQKSPKRKPNDTLAPQGDMDFSRVDIPAIKNSSRRNSLDDRKFQFDLKQTTFHSELILKYGAEKAIFITFSFSSNEPFLWLRFIFAIHIFIV